MSHFSIKSKLILISMSTTATMGIGLIATPTAKGSIWPIASPMGSGLRHRAVLLAGVPGGP